MAVAGTARSELIERHLGLVASVARRYQGGAEPLEDLVQVGTIGLIKAVDRFDPARGTELSTFAVPLIEGEIRHHLRDRVPLVRAPRPVRELGARIRRAADAYAARHGRAPTALELAAALGVGEDDVAAALAGSAGAAGVPLADGAEAAAPDDGFAASEHRLLLAQGWRRLEPRERRILELRFFEDRSQAEIGRAVGLSQAQVSRLIAATLERLRGELDPGGGAVVAPGAAAYSGRAMATREVQPEQRATHSGRLLVRMPQALHAELARAAEREAVSLNALITRTLAGAVGWQDAEEGDRPPAPAREPSGRGRSWTTIALAANLVAVVVAALVAIVLLVVAFKHGF